MSSIKSEYPHRPTRRGKPKSSQSGGGKRKSWTSARTKIDGNHRDISPRLNSAWFQAPLYVEARLKKWAK